MYSLSDLLTADLIASNLAIVGIVRPLLTATYLQVPTTANA